MPIPSVSERCLFRRNQRGCSCHHVFEHGSLITKPALELCKDWSVDSRCVCSTCVITVTRESQKGVRQTDRPRGTAACCSCCDHVTAYVSALRLLCQGSHSSVCCRSRIFEVHVDLHSCPVCCRIVCKQNSCINIVIT
jgi:hypothetical protein